MSETPAPPVIRVVTAVIEHGGRYLITQRRSHALLPLLWEFPGGKVEPGERDEDALRRELQERLGVTATIGARLAERQHTYVGYEVQMALYSASIPPEQPIQALRVNDFRWVASGDFQQYRFPDADQATMDQLLGMRR
ncbi:MAG TPA: (deoxy)nucleoside triphosphate pyrophosphohydrolase [Polyangia bacterium]|jgi:8-oxo-dGTP diphosphatase|nr:(deoxy)nucleoside triphosphate pyrophosphohydrolase [Polyangia bacterium]